MARAIIFLCIFLAGISAGLIQPAHVYAGGVDRYIDELRGAEDDDDRADAAEALGRYGSKHVVRALIFALDDPEDKVVEKAAKSLGRIGDPEAVEPLINLLSSSSSSVKGAAAEALGVIGDPRAIPELERVEATDWNPFLRGVVSEALVKCRRNVGSYHPRVTVEKTETVVVTHTEHPSAVPPPLVSAPPAPSQPAVVLPPQGPLPKVAVLTFRDTASAGTNVGFGDAISEMMTTALIRSNYFEVIERAQIKKILEEQQFSISGSVDSNTAIELGRLLGVEYIVVGSVARLGTLFEADVRVIETQSGKGVLAESGTSRGEENLRAMVNSITDQIIEQYPMLTHQNKQNPVSPTAAK